MKIQKQISDKRGGKTYYKYVVVLPESVVKEAGLKEGDELVAEAMNSEIRLKRQ